MGRTSWGWCSLRLSSGLLLPSLERRENLFLLSSPHWLMQWWYTIDQLLHLFFWLNDVDVTIRWSRPGWSTLHQSESSFSLAGRWKHLLSPKLKPGWLIQVLGMGDFGKVLMQLGWYFTTVILGLFIHGLIVLPILYSVITRTLPFKWEHALSCHILMFSSPYPHPSLLRVLVSFILPSVVTRTVFALQWVQQPPPQVFIVSLSLSLPHN